MPVNIDPARIEACEAERAEIMRRYTPQLKAMASDDPMRPRVWNERADALRTLAEKYTMPPEGN